MSKISKMMEVKDLAIASMLVDNVLTMEFANCPDTIIDLLNEVNEEQKCKFELTIDEWNVLNAVVWHVKELLENRLDKTKDMLEKSAIERFFDTFESVVEKLNADEIF